MLQRIVRWTGERRRKFRQVLKDWATDQLQTGGLKALRAIVENRIKPEHEVLRRLKTSICVSAGQ
jgi:hypothetical protein